MRRESGDSLHLKSGDISTASCIYKNAACSPLGSEKKSLMATLRLLVTMKPTNQTCAVRLRVRIRVEAVTHIRACQVDKSCPVYFKVFARHRQQVLPAHDDMCPRTNRKQKQRSQGYTLLFIGVTSLGSPVLSPGIDDPSILRCFLLYSQDQKG